jgi:hypothetical protein
LTKRLPAVLGFFVLIGCAKSPTSEARGPAPEPTARVVYVVATATPTIQKEDAVLAAALRQEAMTTYTAGLTRTALPASTAVSVPPRPTLQEEKRAEEERRIDERKRIEAGRVEQEWAVIDVQVKQLERAMLEAAGNFENLSQELAQRGKMHLDRRPQFFQTARDRFRAYGGETYDQYISREATRRGLTESRMQTTAEVEHARKTLREIISWACWHPLLREPCKPIQESYADSENWKLPSNE